MATDFKLPELGENVEGGDVLRVLVKPGETLAKDQGVLELETDKATIEVPSSVAGRVARVAVKVGDTVKVGQIVLTVDEDGAAAAETSESAPSPEAAVDARAKTASASTVNGATDRPESAQRSSTVARAAGPEKARPRQNARSTVEGANKGDGKSQESVASAAEAKAEDQPAPFPKAVRAEEPGESDAPPAPATPSVRRLARELGIDIDEVGGSGPDGRISIDDVKAHTKRVVGGIASTRGPAAGEPLPDFSKWGEIDRQPMRAVRRKTAEHLSAAWATIPHVTQHELADITAIEELRKTHGKKVEAAGGALTVTAVAVKIVAAALKIFPQVNASIDLASQTIIYKKYVNVGIAVDTDRGLLVPVIRNADTKNILELAVEIAQLSEKARTSKIGLEEMQGGTFSVSNLGGIGGTYFTPIVNAPEVAILGISRGRVQPVFKDGQFVPRQMLPLSLSYDHRAIDGADGIRFLRWIVDAFEQPFLIALQG